MTKKRKAPGGDPGVRYYSSGRTKTKYLVAPPPRYGAPVAAPTNAFERTLVDMKAWPKYFVSAHGEMLPNTFVVPPRTAIAFLTWPGAVSYQVIEEMAVPRVAADVLAGKPTVWTDDKKPIYSVLYVPGDRIRDTRLGANPGEYRGVFPLSRLVPDSKFFMTTLAGLLVRHVVVGDDDQRSVVIPPGSGGTTTLSNVVEASGEGVFVVGSCRVCGDELLAREERTYERGIWKRQTDLYPKNTHLHYNSNDGDLGTSHAPGAAPPGRYRPPRTVAELKSIMGTAMPVTRVTCLADEAVRKIRRFVDPESAFAAPVFVSYVHDGQVFQIRVDHDHHGGGERVRVLRGGAVTVDLASYYDPDDGTLDGTWHLDLTPPLALDVQLVLVAACLDAMTRAFGTPQRVHETSVNGIVTPASYGKFVVETLGALFARCLNDADGKPLFGIGDANRARALQVLRTKPAAPAAPATPAAPADCPVEAKYHSNARQGPARDADRPGCRGKIFPGLDGRMYVSSSTRKDGKYTWKLYRGE